MCRVGKSEHQHNSPDASAFTDLGLLLKHGMGSGDDKADVKVLDSEDRTSIHVGITLSDDSHVHE